MFVRFTTGTSSGGHFGFQNAIIATATANANFTPSLPTGCVSYDVLSNTEAGGWVVNTAGSTLMTQASSTGAHVVLQAGLSSKDFGIDEMAKHIKFDFDHTSGDFENVYFGVTVPNNNSSHNSNTNFYSSGALSPKPQIEDATASFHPRDWFMSITSDYCFLWEISSASGFPKFFGATDFDGVPAAYRSISNMWAPFAGVYSSNGTTHHRMTAQFLMNGLFASKRHAGMSELDAGTWTAIESTDSTLETYALIPRMDFYTYDSTSNPNEFVYHKAFNSNGDIVDSLNPIGLFAPQNNWPYMTLKGIKAVGRFEHISNDDQSVAVASQTYHQYRNKIVYDENGYRYMIIHFNRHAPIALRCV
jgi:hypothetical protein